MARYNVVVLLDIPSYGAYFNTYTPLGGVCGPVTVAVFKTVGGRLSGVPGGFDSQPALKRTGLRRKEPLHRWTGAMNRWTEGDILPSSYTPIVSNLEQKCKPHSSTSLRRSLAYIATSMLPAISGFLGAWQNTHLVECKQMKGWKPDERSIAKRQRKRRHRH